HGGFILFLIFLCLQRLLFRRDYFRTTGLNFLVRNVALTFRKDDFFRVWGIVMLFGNNNNRWLFFDGHLL
ncbi:hypothetical protein SERLADRAFT_377477, partial [Serpula lacrymans var. lacrymans S7.9]